MAQSTALFPIDYVPHNESLSEVKAREDRLIGQNNLFYNDLKAAIANETISKWVDNYLPRLDTANVYATLPDYTIFLNGLVHLAIDNPNYADALKPILITKLKNCANLALKDYSMEIVSTKSKYPTINSLGLDASANCLLTAGICLQKLGCYNGAIKDSTESFITNYIENKGIFIDSFRNSSHNKEMYLMDIGSNVSYLYRSDATLYPHTKKTFEYFWKSITQINGYENDNSPHYDASSGMWLILRMALLHNRLDDLKIRDDIHRMLVRMANTVANSGENAKWSKNVERNELGNSLLAIDAGPDVPWDLKIGYLLFNDPYLLYVARKYEDLRMNGPITVYKKTPKTIYPSYIDFLNIRNVMPSANVPYSLVTKRLVSSNPNGQAKGAGLDRGGKDTKLVQDKLIISTGHHPRAPYLLMDLSYSQNKASSDHRISIDNLDFDGVHLCTYPGRSGNGTHFNRPILVPDTIPFPLVNAPIADVYASSQYQRKMGMDLDYKFNNDYIIKTDSTINLDSNAAYGMVEYGRFQYKGVSAKRELLLLHNGILLVVDRIRTDSSFKGGFNAGVLYQVWPTIKSSDTKKRWVLQGKHLPNLVDKDTQCDGISTLFYFPEVGMTTQTNIQTDINRPSSKICQVFSSSRAIRANDSLDILSMVLPIRNPSLVKDLIRAISTKEKDGNFDVQIPYTLNDKISVRFEKYRLPIVKYELQQ